MILNKMQQKVVESKKRVVVITAQAGSGSTTALLVKLLEEAHKNSNSLVTFLRRSKCQAEWHVKTMLEEYPKARYSEKSSILSVPYKGKTVKIKFIGLSDLNLEEHIPVIAIDQASQFEDIAKIISVSGKVILTDYLSNVEKKDSWAYMAGLLRKVEGMPYPVWNECVDHIIGYSHDNPGIDPRYIQNVYELQETDILRLMRVKFKL